MALISKASLLMVPSTYEEGTLYNVLPSGNRAPDSTDQNSGYDQTRADFSFDRGSNAAATRIGSDGLIKKYRENLLKNSNNFNTTGTAWNPTSAYTLTSGQSGYDGSNDAWLLNKTTTANDYFQQRSIVGMSGNVIAISIYAKDNNIGGLTIFNANGFAQFKLTGSGSIISHTGIDAKIEPVSGASGWFRCSLSVGGGSAYDRLMFKPTAENATDTSGSIFIQSAQLEIGLAATDVIESGATTAKAGVLVDLPRINYDANGENGSLLLEPSRQQLLQYSEYLGSWSLNTAGISSIQPNNAVSPEGLQNAYKVNFVVQSDSDLALAQTHSITGGSTYTYSIYIKGEGSNIGKDVVVKSKRIGGGDSAGTTTTQTLTNEWKRIDFATTYAANNINGRLLISSNDATSCLVYGAQAELGSYSSSYIPNHGTSSGVTRAADDSVATGLGSIAGQSEGTLFAYFKTIGDSGTPYISLNQNNGVSNRVLIYNNSGISVEVRVGGTKQAEFTTSTQGLIKAAIAYKANDFVFYINGSLIGADSSGSTFGAGVLEQLNLGFGAQDGAEIHQLALFNERLTNAELATLTTL